MPTESGALKTILLACVVNGWAPPTPKPISPVLLTNDRLFAIITPLDPVVK